MKDSHYLRFDSPGWNSRFGRAVCGALIEAAKEFSALPTCPRCKTWIADGEAGTEDELFGPMKTVKDV
jgi:hypothetical protein